ncbi:hypothetical protein LZQ00_05835 [Sphingobacterium sp. SRCM116780]|uniref:hypothetical protein n=1 Tax=Sphingobacterium sp. SRCM116780 TaxID=2907623 RepID=UPI001F264E55|nr:hypothetical protein [Sphingobacterium sp. SRCM116780]UIR57335.1 hypothetical protein LZQ00_05835 [Sphingobacterium sp. SRCM116780]
MEKFQKFQKHGLAVFAVAIAVVTLMSMRDKDHLVSNWYPVSGSNITSSTPLPSPPSNDPNAPCSTSKSEDMCAIEIELDSSQPFPSTVSDAQTNHTVLDEAYREE